MLQFVFSRLYIAWLVISSIGVATVVLSLFYPQWLIRNLQISPDNSTRSSIIYSTWLSSNCVSGMLDKSINPISVCETFCSYTKIKFECSWLWDEIMQKWYASSFLDLFIFISVLIGTSALSLAYLLVLTTSALRDIKGVSLFKIAGVFFFVGAIFFILIMLFWLFNWTNMKFRSVCGPQSQLFNYHFCHGGWPMYTYSVGVLILIVAGIMANFADESVCNEHVEEHLLMSEQINFV